MLSKFSSGQRSYRRDWRVAAAAVAAIAIVGSAAAAGGASAHPAKHAAMAPVKVRLAASGGGCGTVADKGYRVGACISAGGFLGGSVLPDIYITSLPAAANPSTCSVTWWVTSTANLTNTSTLIESTGTTGVEVPCAVGHYNLPQVPAFLDHNYYLTVDVNDGDGGVQVDSLVLGT